MNNTSSPCHDQHQQVQLLLPWYVNESLNSDERREVESHIRSCLVCRRELIALRKLSEAVTQGSDLELAAENSFASLARRLPPRVAESTVAPIQQDSKSKGGNQRHMPHSAFFYAMAASVVLALIPLLAIQLVSVMPADSFYTLSSANPAAKGDLRVVFAHSTSAMDISEVLTQLHGQQVGQLNSVGAMTVRLKHDAAGPSLQQAIAMLRKRQDVLLAEPVSQP